MCIDYIQKNMLETGKPGYLHLPVLARQLSNRKKIRNLQAAIYQSHHCPFDTVDGLETLLTSWGW